MKQKHKRKDFYFLNSIIQHDRFKNSRIFFTHIFQHQTDVLASCSTNHSQLPFSSKQGERGTGRKSLWKLNDRWHYFFHKMKYHITNTLVIQIEKNFENKFQRQFFAQKPKQQIFDLENKLRHFLNLKQIFCKQVMF